MATVKTEKAKPALIKTLLEARMYSYHPSELNDLEEAARSKQAGALKYIDHLCSVTKCYREAATMPMELYRKEDQRFETDRTKINTIFFTWREKCPPEKANESTVPQEVLMEMQGHVKRHLDDQYYKAQESYNRAKADIEHHSKALSFAEKNMLAHATSMQALQALKHSGMDIRPEIERILRDGYFNLNPDAAKFLSFVTRDEISLSYFNATQGVEHFVNLGQLRVDVAMSADTGYRLTVLPYKNNLEGVGTVHPHVTGSGAICWGQFGERAKKASAGLNLRDLMNCIGELLYSYNRDSAYIQIETYVEFRAKLNKVTQPPAQPVVEF